MGGYVLAIDEGTTSTRAIVFDEAQRIRGLAQREFVQHFPTPGWVEHDADEIWRLTVDVMREALAAAQVAARDLAAIGITNQRETIVVWDRATGKPIHRAIVWQDRRTSDMCARLAHDGAEPDLVARTGLLIDPYFSATKLAWLLDHVPGARARAAAGELAFGTIDTFLLWRLTGGRVDAADVTNASRTQLFNIGTLGWDDDLLKLFDVPRALLPEVRPCAAEFGASDPALLGAPVAIRGIAGDQQAALIGQACFAPGMVKSTYGTGCFALLNTGAQRVTSRNRLLTTVGYQIGGETAYALEGAIFIAGAALQWLRDGLKLIARADEADALARAADAAQAVYFVPAFTGLGAPWWDPDARGALYGLTRNTGRAELVRAALDAVCYQTSDLIDAMRRDWQGGQSGEGVVLRVDGGMAASNWTMQRLADVVDAPVDRPALLETTALGAAWLAGMQAGAWPDARAFQAQWQCERRFTPALAPEARARALAGWRDAVARTRSTRPS